MFLPQGHKRAPSDTSVASSEDEKTPLSPSILESVPEKVEVILPSSIGVPAGNHVVDTSSVEVPPARAEVVKVEETPSTPVEDGEATPKLGETKKEEEMDVEAEEVASPEEGEKPVKPEEPVPPVKEMEELELASEEEKELDTAEVQTNEAEGSQVTEEKMDTVEDPAQPTDEELTRGLRVTLTLPDEHKPSPSSPAAPREEKGERAKEREQDKPPVEVEKVVPEKTKNEKERDSDSGSGSAADNSSVDLNLSISSFLTKTKEPGTVSIQVSKATLPSRKEYHRYNVYIHRVDCLHFVMPGHQTPEEDVEEDQEVHGGRGRGQRDHFEDCHRQRHQKRGDEVPQVNCLSPHNGNFPCKTMQMFGANVLTRF